MDFIIFDLEFNQAFKEDKPFLKKKCPFEILQIGAIKLDHKLNIINSFNKLVKPMLYTQLHPFVQELTKIEPDDLLHAQPFPKVYDDFTKFVGHTENIFCVWGTADMKELFRNVSYYKLNYGLLPKGYINVQKHASKHLNTPSGTSIGLRNAVELLHITLDKNFHDALNDAYYTSEIFKKLNLSGISPNIYIPTQSNRPSGERKVRMKIDKSNLIKQFEKMYNRSMTDEEISIILLAYKMGLTHQFQVEVKNAITDSQ